MDLNAVLTGNWLGSGLVALVALVTTGFLGGVLALLAKPDEFGVGNTLTMATWIANAAFGADLTASVDVEGADGSAAIDLFPLTITVIVLALAVLLFRRMIRNYPSPYAALGDAARTSLIFAIGLMIPAIIFRSDNEELGRGPIRELTEDESGLGLKFGASVPGSLFLGFLIIFLVLALVVFVRRDWWSARVRRVHDWLAAPFFGYATMLAALPVAGLIGYLLLGFGKDTVDEADPTNDTSTILAAVFALLGNGGMWVLGLGSGASIGGEMSDDTDDDTSLGAGTGTSDSSWEHLWGQVTDDEPGLWISPLIMLVVLAVSAVVVARRSPSKEQVLPNLLVWAAGLLVFVPLLVRLSGAHFAMDLSNDEASYAATAYGGIHGLQATFFLFVVGLVVAVALAALTGTLDLRRLRQQVIDVAGRFQTYPARPLDPAGPPPSGPPPSGPPPNTPPPGPPPSGPPPAPPPQSA